jgi:hypothetical protein
MRMTVGGALAPISEISETKIAAIPESSGLNARLQELCT